jgi:hypothetical protein
MKTKRKPRINLTGQKFGRLKVLSFARMGKNSTDSFWLCECDCGKKKIVASRNIKVGRTKSCGCLSIEKKSQIGKKHSSWAGYEEISQTFFKETEYKAQLRNFAFQVSIQYLWDLFLQQKRQCQYTKRTLVFAATRQDRGTASLDRIDSSKGYVKGNVQWVHKDVNMMKRNFSEKQFLQLCKEVTQNNI